MAKCCDCEWWRKWNITDDDKGTCKKHPPIGTEPTYDGIIAKWPWTFSTDWCGEFEEKKE